MAAAAEAAASAGCTTVVEPRRVLAWKGEQRRGPLRFADGWSLHRLWLERGRWALGLSPQRVYLDGAGRPIARPEHEIVRGDRPSGPPGALRVQQARALVDAMIGSGLLGECRPVPVEPVPGRLDAERGIIIGEHRVLWDGGTLGAAYRRHGLDGVPRGMVVTVCPVGEVPAGVAERFVAECRARARQFGIDARFGVLTPGPMVRHLRQMQAEARAAVPGRCVLLLLPRRAEPAGADALELLRDLEASGVPCRRAFADDPFEFSVSDQMPSLVMACGGTPHRVELSDIRQSLWSVGIDLSHRGRESTLALTLVDPAGRLHRAWTVRQARDETARESSLRAPLALARRELTDADPGANVLVIRDGRTMERENPAQVHEAFGANTTVIEFRKRGNPMVIRPAGEPAVVPGPSAFVVGAGGVIFLAAAPSRLAGEPPAVCKVVCDDRWNGLRLDHAELARALVRLAAAPGLGLHARHLPAPLYWADGLAGAGDGDLRHRGQARCERLKDSERLARL